MVYWYFQNSVHFIRILPPSSQKTPTFCRRFFVYIVHLNQHSEVALSKRFIIENMNTADITQRIIKTPQIITNERPVFQIELMTEVR